MKAIVVLPNCIELREVTDLHETVGGFFQCLPVGEDFTVFIDEDGKAKGLPRNQRAEDIIRRMLDKVDRTLIPGDFIVGPAVFVGLDGGDEVDLPEEVIKEFFPLYAPH